MLKIISDDKNTKQLNIKKTSDVQRLTRAELTPATGKETKTQSRNEQKEQCGDRDKTR